MVVILFTTGVKYIISGMHLSAVCTCNIPFQLSVSTSSHLSTLIAFFHHSLTYPPNLHHRLHICLTSPHLTSPHLTSSIIHTDARYPSGSSQSTNMSSCSDFKRIRVDDLLNHDEPASFASMRNLSTNTRVIRCTIDNCGKEFLSEESLLSHQRRSHAAPTKNVCPHCHSSFSNVPNLNKHVSFHSYYERHTYYESAAAVFHLRCEVAS